MTAPAEEVKLKPGRTVNEIRATSSLVSLHSLADSEDSPVCWICLDGAASEKPLYKPCKCPRYCHSSCIARWQLQSAGSRKETHCEFCQETLPDWKQVLTPSCGANAPAVMNVNFDGRTYSFEVTPGESGYKLFTEAIRNAFSLPEDSELNITFTCDEPSTAGALLTLQGAGAYDAAVHCASVSAARRIALQPHITVPADPARAPATPSPSTTAAASSAAAASQPQAPAQAQAQQQQAAQQQQQQQQAAQQQQQQERRPQPQLQPQLSSSAALANKPRRMAALGRKLRTALCDLLALK